MWVFDRSWVTREKGSHRDKVVSQHHTPQDDKKQLAGQFPIQKLAYCRLQFGKLVSPVKEPTWYIYMVYVYNSIPDPNMADIYLNQMFFVMLNSSASKYKFVL